LLAGLRQTIFGLDEPMNYTSPEVLRRFASEELKTLDYRKANSNAGVIGTVRKESTGY
jgi:hypothetical protein